MEKMVGLSSSKFGGNQDALHQIIGGKIKYTEFPKSSQ
ncbi:hypothetical protein F975_03094 [Acinetobacter sp. ANC 3789]|nr:hypothetical protein F975_03094 [Acinetobacter sp. ANC 3789]